MSLKILVSDDRILAVFYTAVILNALCPANSNTCNGGFVGRCVYRTVCTMSYCRCTNVQWLYQRTNIPSLRRNLFLQNWFDLHEVKDWLLYKYVSAGWQFECDMTVRQEARFGEQ
jgi:hypothetical protein